jgi:hypothetical protein
MQGTPHIAETTPTRQGYMVYQIIELAGGVAGRLQLIVDPTYTFQSEYRLEVFNRNTLSWNELHRIDPYTVGKMPQTGDSPDALDRLRKLADELVTRANEVLSMNADELGHRVTDLEKRVTELECQVEPRPTGPFVGGL